ncbi:MAG TPA: CrcB family protein [Streptosporangiaceae bacterium]|nr:CrcB family protein [Streptosporangiaceae bacterium]
MTVLLVALGAAIGAPARYFTDRAVQVRHDSVFPWGTFIVNIAGSALLGFLAALPTHGTAGTVLGVAFCGAFTTYSTFAYETFRLAEQRAYLFATLNTVASIIAALGAAYCGMAIAQAVTPAP